MNRDKAEKILDSLNFEKGLLTAIARDFKDGEILMVGFMNEKAVLETLTQGIMHYWSREREKLWKKGEESGNVQEVHEVLVDCDSDALLFDVDAKGPACHKGYRSCFYRKITDDGKFEKILERKFDPDKVYG